MRIACGSSPTENANAEIVLKYLLDSLFSSRLLARSLASSSQGASCYISLTPSINIAFSSLLWQATPKQAEQERVSNAPRIEDDGGRDERNRPANTCL